MSKSIVVRAPKIVIEELDTIKIEDKIDDNQVAFYQMVKYSQVGREARNIMRFKWPKVKR